MEKLRANGDEPLVEDLELPPKQRPTATRPRLPASGKIPPPTGAGLANTSPQKRPLPPTSQSSSKPGAGSSEPSKKKIKKNSGAAADASGANAESAVDGALSSPTLEAKTLAGNKSADKSKGTNDLSTATSQKTGTATGAGSDMVNGEDSVALAGDTDSHPSKPNGTTISSVNRNAGGSVNTGNAASDAEGSGNHGAGMMSPESINGQA